VPKIAADNGVRAGHRILSIGGEDVKSMSQAELQDCLTKLKPTKGNPVEVVFGEAVE